jgi:signal transduction histidine kinase
VGAATAFTLLVSVTSFVRFAYRSPSLHVAVETAAALISLLAAQLMYGRFRRSLERGDLLLMAALVMFAGSNLLFSALPATANLESGPFETWAPAFGGALATGLLAAGAFARPCRIGHPAAAARQALDLCVLGLIVIAAATGFAHGWLPTAIDPGLSPEGLARPRIVGDPAVLVTQLVVMVLFAAAAVGFARTAERTRDHLITWFAIGATLAAFARVNYFLFPSLYSEYFYTGDVLRLGFFVALLVGGILELRISQRELEHAAVFDERRRLARDIHDGVAQDLAFIVQQAGALEGRDGASPAMADIATAARRALSETRWVIDALARATDEPLGDALERVAEEAAGRWGARVETATAVDGLQLSVAAREAVLRIVGEAVTNAARHAHAQTIRVELVEQPELRLRIVDDGVGFDAAAVAQAGSHGIVGMRERSEQIGGRLHVQSSLGEGTEVVVDLS